MHSLPVARRINPARRVFVATIGCCRVFAPPARRGAETGKHTATFASSAQVASLCARLNASTWCSLRFPCEPRPYDNPLVLVARCPRGRRTRVRQAIDGGDGARINASARIANCVAAVARQPGAQRHTAREKVCHQRMRKRSAILKTGLLNSVVHRLPRRSLRSARLERGGRRRCGWMCRATGWPNRCTVLSGFEWSTRRGCLPSAIDCRARQRHRTTQAAERHRQLQGDPGAYRPWPM